MTTPIDPIREALPVVVVFPRGQLSEDDKARMELHGIVCVEADSPKDVCQLQLAAPLFTSQITGDAFVMAALKAMASRPSATTGGYITEAGHVKGEFVQRLAAALKEPS